MFDIGWGELLVIGIVALIAIGPKELPGVLRTIGKYVAKVKRMSAEFQSQFQDALREAEVADLKKHADDFTNSIADFENYNVTASESPASGSDVQVEASAASDLGAKPSSVESIPAQSADVQVPDDALPKIDVPLPEPVEPTFNDAAEVSKPPKQVGGNA